MIECLLLDRFCVKALKHHLSPKKSLHALSLLAEHSPSFFRVIHAHYYHDPFSDDSRQSTPLFPKCSSPFTMIICHMYPRTKMMMIRVYKTHLTVHKMRTIPFLNAVWIAYARMIPRRISLNSRHETRAEAHRIKAMSTYAQTWPMFATNAFIMLIPCARSWSTFAIRAFIFVDRPTPKPCRAVPSRRTTARLR